MAGVVCLGCGIAGCVLRNCLKGDAFALVGGHVQSKSGGAVHVHDTRKWGLSVAAKQEHDIERG